MNIGNLFIGTRELYLEMDDQMERVKKKDSKSFCNKNCSSISKFLKSNF